MILECFTVGPLQENCYLLADSRTKEAVLIDPGDEAARLLEALDTRGLTLRAVWLTHAHFDHVGAVADILERYPVLLYLHPADAPLLAHASASAARWGIPLKQPPADFLPLEDDQILTLGSLQAHCLFTPGHAPGHIAFYLPEEDMVIAGDALFQGSIGRTDLPGGDHARLLESIRTKLLTLPPETKVYPGHGPATTVGEEAQSNPFLI